MPKLPASIVAVDVETTGLRSDDRIVTLGAWRLKVFDQPSDRIVADCLHIIVDPGKSSHPRAEQVHGYSDWVLRHQQPFSDHANVVRDFLSSGDVIVAHNASFDFRFIAQEYENLGQAVTTNSRYCTMDGYRQSGRTGRASLNAVCGEMGLRRQGQRHGALEDAWLALMVYLWLHDAPTMLIQPFEKVAARNTSLLPFNYCEPPQIPNGPIPTRRASKLAKARELSAARKVTKAKLMAAVRPTAILLLEIARASDTLAAEEIDILVSLIRATTSRLGLPIDDEVEFEVLAEIFEVNLSQNQLTRSARALYEDDAARLEFPRWFAMMATADGDVSEAERAAIERVKAAITRILPE